MVIVRKDLIHTPSSTNSPIVMDWRTFKDSTGPTPNIFSIYLTSLNLHQMIQNGGLQYYHCNSLEKSTLVYKYIDTSNGFYTNKIPEKHRSRTNITFCVHDSESLRKSLHKYKNNGFIGIVHTNKTRTKVVGYRCIIVCSYIKYKNS